MKMLRSNADGLVCFLFPFLLLAGVAFWMSLRMSRPEAALEMADHYLENQYPGVHWERAELLMIGESLGKKWRLEYRGTQPDGRRIRANLIVDRWRPEHLSGRFVMIFDPQQILDGGWDNPSAWDRAGARLSKFVFLSIGLALLLLEMLWLYRTYRHERFRRADALLLLVLGGMLLFTMLVLETHPGFIAACGLIFAIMGLLAMTRKKESYG
ncbi:MAG: hypothetical protein NTW71_03985 [Deltaproteobacteria bacterium]|nr:hypothetical protein [Deltaproteobacteria bacterium]